MKIHLYLPEFPPLGDRLTSGMIKAVHGLAAGLARCGGDVVVLCEGAQTSSLKTRFGYDIRCFDYGNGGVGTGGERIESYIDRCTDPGIFVLNGVFNPHVNRVSRALRRNNFPYVLAPHDPYHKSIFATNWHLKWPYWYLRERPMLRAAKAVQVLDIRHAEWLRNLKIRTPVFEVTNGYAPEDVLPESGLTWRTSGAPRLLYLGRIDSHNKGLDLLLDAFGDVIDRADLRLTLQGPDWGDRAAMQNRAARLGLDETHVQFVEPDFNKPSAVIAAEHDIFCLPSRFEGFGLSALEAILAGRVLMVSDIAGIAPHVRASGCGVVVSPDVKGIKTGLFELLAKRHRWKEMGMSGRAYVLKHLRWERIATEAIEKYRSLLSNSVNEPMKVNPTLASQLSKA